tara:strand:- start:87 stop:428 length:342 start_codon:yes stop_codon:yes gene_type:complete
VERNDDWFENPLDSMPIANGDNKYHPDENKADWYDNAPSEYEPPMTDNDWFIDKPKDTYSSRHKSTPDSEKSAEEVVTMHEKMYRIATAKYNPFAIGGSESLNSIGGSENHVK